MSEIDGKRTLYTRYFRMVCISHTHNEKKQRGMTCRVHGKTIFTSHLLLSSSEAPIILPKGHIDIFLYLPFFSSHYSNKNSRCQPFFVVNLSLLSMYHACCERGLEKRLLRQSFFFFLEIDIRSQSEVPGLQTLFL